LLIQKEVAERMAAEPGEMSILAVSSQVYSKVRLGDIVPAELFTPPPKVDSRVVILEMLSEPRISPDEEKAFFRVVKAGFVAKRKKLRSSIASGLHLSKPEAEELLVKASISPESRAQDLSMEDWIRLTKVVEQ
jgi:16S rRNA (adenine1518-N6/adenine1519-N6)-dimethyltransferase